MISNSTNKTQGISFGQDVFLLTITIYFYYNTIAYKWVLVTIVLLNLGLTIIGNAIHLHKCCH